MDDKDDKEFKLQGTVTGRFIDPDAEWRRLMQTAEDQMRSVTGRMTSEERAALKNARFLEAYGTPQFVLHTPNGPDDGQRIRDLFNSGGEGPWHLIQMEWPPGDMPNFHEVPLGEPMVCTLGMDTPEYWGISREEWARRVEAMDFSDLEARIASIRPEGPPIRILDGKFHGAEIPHDVEYIRSAVTRIVYDSEAMQRVHDRTMVVTGGSRIGRSFNKAGIASVLATAALASWGEAATAWESSPAPAPPPFQTWAGTPQRYGNNKKYRSAENRAKKKLAKKSKRRNRT